jgi:cell division protein FtsW (lipid II flippase)
MNRREIAIHTLKMALFIGIAFAFGLISILSMGFHKPIRETLRWIPSYWVNHIGLFLVGFVGIWICSNRQPRNWGFSINHPKINLSILLGILLAIVGFLQELGKKAHDFSGGMNCPVNKDRNIYKLILH